MSGITGSLSEASTRSVQWLWEPYLARGKLAILDGDPGVGKSLITVDLAARLSRGGPLPGGAVAGRPKTLFLSGEDDVADTTRPRAEAAGADLERLVVASLLRSPMTLPADLEKVAAAVEAYRADLLVIDPISAFLAPEIAANAEHGVRRVLSSLARLAERYDCAVLLIRHLRKLMAAKALYRGLGSIGFIAAARTGLLATRHPHDPDRYVLAVTKSNLADMPPSLEYCIRGSADDPGRAVIEWAGPVCLDADTLGEVQRPLRPRDRAADWLRAELAGGPRKAADLHSAAAAAGIPERTLKPAKAELGAESRQVNRNGASIWLWYDPTPGGQAQTCTLTSGILCHAAVRRWS